MVNEKKMTDGSVFQQVFASGTEESNQALIAFLNIVLEKNNEEIVSVNFIDPDKIEDYDEIPLTKFFVEALMKNGKTLVVELLAYDPTMMINRISRHATPLIFYSLRKYGRMSDCFKTVIISIVDGVMIEDHDSVFSSSFWTVTETGIVYYNILEYGYLELGKMQGKPDPDSLSRQEALAVWLKYAGVKEMASYLQKVIETHGEDFILFQKVFDSLEN